MAAPATKSYVKLAATLVVTGMGLFSIERFILAKPATASGGASGGMIVDPTVLSILAIVPLALIVSGALVFIVGRMRRR